MEKNAVFGELLYIGLVFEKGRCKRSGIWNSSYIKSLKIHIGLLIEIAKCMQKELSIEKDNYLLKTIYYEIKSDSILKNTYHFYGVIDGLDETNYLITVCKSKNEYKKIAEFIIRLLGDILSELDKGFRRDKEKICKLIFALHNLPRVYLSMEEPTLCLIGQRGIDLDDALNYSKMSMDDEMIVCYKNYFA